MAIPTECRDGLWNGAIALRNRYYYCNWHDFDHWLSSLNRSKHAGFKVEESRNALYEDFQEFILPIELML